MKRSTVHIVLCTLVLLGAVLACEASVTVKGRVMYWDQLQNGYVPAKGAHVEVEGDWFLFFDPDVPTDDQGYYTANVEDPGFWDNYHYDDVDIEVYAETPGTAQVYENMWCLWPYHAISKEYENVRAGDSLEINVWIGDELNNVTAWYRNTTETANAFTVHQRVMDQYVTLRKFGWPKSDFDEAEVIVPAATPFKCSYYLHATGFINLYLKSAGVSGTGPWDVLPQGYSKNGQIQLFRNTVQHEYAHCIQDEMSGWVPLVGLNMPSDDHSIETATNRYLAYTEAFAHFLPLAVGNVTNNKLEASRNVTGFPIPFTLPQGEHAHMEGEVAAVFWDLFDPLGDEPYRRPPAASVDGKYPVPPGLRSALRWRDRLQDPNLQRMRTVVKSYAPLWPVQTVGEFIQKYRDHWPADLHALKAICYNRDIGINLPGETPAALSGKPSVQRFARKLNFALDLKEPDAEDRPFVSVQVWLQQANQVVLLGTGTAEGAWNGDAKAISLGVELPASAAASDPLWIVVTDEIAPQAYRIDQPGELVVTILPIPMGITHRVEDLPPKTFDPDLHASPVRVLGKAGTFSVRLPDKDDENRVARMRQLVSGARTELRNYAERQEASLRYERTLLKLSHTSGTPPMVDAPMESIPKRIRHQAEAPSFDLESAPVLAGYRKWRADVLRGQVKLARLTDPDRVLLGRARGELERLAAEQESASTRLNQLQTAIEAAAADLPYGPESEEYRAASMKAVGSLKEALSRIRGDEKLATRLRSAAKAYAALGGPAGGTSAVGPTNVPGPLHPSGIEAVRDFQTLTLHREAAQAVARVGGIQTPRDLLAQARTKAGLQSLAGRARLSAEQVLFLAHEVEMRGVLGERPDTSQNLKLLKQIGIETVRNLAECKDHPQRLYRLVADRAVRSGLAAPTSEQIEVWVANAAAAADKSLPPSSELLPQPAMGPSRIDAQSVMDAYSASRWQPVPVTADGAVLQPNPLLPGHEPGRFFLPTGTKECAHEFVAWKPGLYCARIRMDLMGPAKGPVKLYCAVDRPIITSSAVGSSPFDQGGVLLKNLAATDLKTVNFAVSGWKPTISSNEMLRPNADQLFVFYLPKTVIPVTGRMRLRIEDPTVGAASVTTTDTEFTSPPSRPGVTGTIDIQYIDPVRASSFDCTVPIPAEATTKCPLVILETPLYQSPPQKDSHLPSYLSFMVSHASKISSKADNETIYAALADAYGTDKTTGQLFKDDTIVTSSARSVTATSDGKYTFDLMSKLVSGVEIIDVVEPATGSYRVPLATNPTRSPPSLKTLATQGALYAADTSAVATHEVHVTCRGLNTYQQYVAELVAVEVSSQFEPDKSGEDNDDGWGEFHIKTSAALLQQVGFGSLNEVEENLSTCSRPWPFLPEEDIMHYVHVRTDSTGRHVVFPHMPMIDFSDPQVDYYKFDNLALSVSVVEDDETSWWGEFKEFAKGMIECFKIMKGLYDAGKGNPGSLFGAIQAGTQLAEISGGMESGPDDTCGNPAVHTSIENGWGVPDRKKHAPGAGPSLNPNNDLFDGENYFAAQGPADREHFQCEQVPASGDVFQGHVTTTMQPEWAAAWIKMKRFPCYFSWSDIQLTSFKLCEGTDGPGEATNVDIDFGALGTPMWPPKNQVLTGNPYQFKCEAKPGQLVQVREASPPLYAPSPYAQDLLLPYPEDVKNPALIQFPTLLQTQHGRRYWCGYSYFQAHFYDDDPGTDYFLGVPSFTLYHDDVWKYADLGPQQLDPYGIITMTSHSPTGGLPLFKVDITIRDPGSWLEEVNFVAYVYIYGAPRTAENTFVPDPFHSPRETTPPETVPANQGKLQVALLDAVTREPIYGLEVRLLSAQGKELRSLEADYGRKLEFVNVPFGEYQVEARGGVYAAKRQTVTINQAAGRLEVLVSTRPAAEPEQGTPSIPPPAESTVGRLEVVVLDADTRQPVNGLEVRLLDVDGQELLSKETNQGNRTEFANVGYGIYQVEARGAPYARKRQTVTINQAAGRLEVLVSTRPDAEPEQDVTVPQAPPAGLGQFNINLSVVDSQQRPLEGTRVEIRLGESEVTAGQSNGLGAFTAGPFRPQRYYAVVSKPGYRTNEIDTTIVDRDFTGRIALEPVGMPEQREPREPDFPPTAPPTDLARPRGESLKVRVVAPDNQAANNEQVVVGLGEGPTQQIKGSASTNRLGMADINDLPAENWQYWVRVVGPDGSIRGEAEVPRQWWQRRASQLVPDVTVTLRSAGPGPGVSGPGLQPLNPEQLPVGPTGPRVVPGPSTTSLVVGVVSNDLTDAKVSLMLGDVAKQTKAVSTTGGRQADGSVRGRVQFDGLPQNNWQYWVRATASVGRTADRQVPMEWWTRPRNQGNPNFSDLAVELAGVRDTGMGLPPRQGEGPGFLEGSDPSRTPPGATPGTHARAPGTPALMVDVRSAHGNKLPIPTAQIDIVGFQGQPKWTILKPGLYGIDVPQGKYRMFVRSPGYKAKTVDATVGPTGATVSVELSTAIE